jgi:hypothetical protein
MDLRQELFPARWAWPGAVDDVNLISTEATDVRLVSGAKNLRRLNTLTRLKALWCFDINDAALDSICNCPSLESLFIENLKTGNVDCLSGLTKLSTLSLDTCSKITSLEFLTKLPALSGLAITNFKNVHNLTPLAEMVSLRSLAVAGGMWTRMKVSSFAPLGRLGNLEFLHLTNIKAEDESLKPLAALSHLKQLDIANFYSMSEFAQLSRRLQGTECTWFQILCTDCDAAMLDRHIQDWKQATTQGP